MHALLDGPSVAGAYRFEIEQGRNTTMLVDAILFPRVDLVNVGLAPETSMYMFSPNGRSRADDFRPQVHDSDGLLIFNGRGEQLWRPLANPARLQLNAFEDQRPRGFGLMQRDRNLADYQDFEAHFEQRPDLGGSNHGATGVRARWCWWRSPPTPSIHDNIVAYWHPRQPIRAGSEYHLSYRLVWGNDPSDGLPPLHVVETAHGRADVKGPTAVRQFVVDFSEDSQRCRPSARSLKPPSRPLPERSRTWSSAITRSRAAIASVLPSTPRRQNCASSASS